VRLEIQTEVSHLDPTIQIRDTPGIQANRMRTQVDARFGAPLLLSGLLQKNMHERSSGLPLLSKLPILGPLFGSNEYQNDQSELVAVLVPSATPPDAPLQRMKKTLVVEPFEVELLPDPAPTPSRGTPSAFVFRHSSALPLGLRNGASR
ncbi:MAG: hypothetical protein AAB425_10970, partial [Bdellovibrionota bacterium]